MTVSSLVPVNIYAGNSSCKKFDFDFLIESDSELVVQHTDKNGITTILKNGIDYSIGEIGNKNGSYIIFPLEKSSYGVLKNDEKISLLLDLVIKQESEFRNSSYFNFNILEWTFDYIVRILQILNRKIERCIKVREGDAIKPDDLLNEIQQNKIESHNWADYSQNKANEAQESANLAKDWAIKTESKVQDIDYSAKYYALEASGYARQAQAYSTLRYNVFCVNTGLVENGNPAFLKLEDNILKTVSNFDITNAKGKTYTFTEELSYDISKLKNGVYNIFINPESKNINVISNTIYAQTFLTETALVGDYFLNISKVPYELFEKTQDNDMEQLENDVFVAVLTLKGNKKILNINPYNKNIIDLKIENEIYANKTSYNLFDLVQKDHILTFEEKEGLELLGEYVYKEAQDGRYGYPDFYQKCVDEYETLENKKENIYVSSNITGSISDNNGLISGFNNARYATVNQTIVTEDAQNPWEFVLKVKMPDVAANCAIIGSGADSQKYGMTLRTTTANKLTLYVSGNGINWNIVNAVTSTNTFELDKEYLIKISYSLTGEPENQTATYKVDLKTEKEEVWTNYITKEVTSITSSSSEDTYKIADFTPTLGIDYNVVFTGSIDLNKSYIKIKDEIFWTGVDTVAIRTNLNGHWFYDIKDKDKIDKIYQKTGFAWYYGIDEENKCIFLPRKRNRYIIERKEPTESDPTWYNLYSDGWCEQGGNLMPNADYYIVILPKPYKDTEYTILSKEGYVGVDDLRYRSYTDKTPTGFRVYRDYTYDNRWYTFGYVELPKDLKIYEYMVVGNTTVKKVESEITEVTTSDNDTLPLYTGMYFDFKPNHVSWLKTGETASGTIYPSAYNELLKILKKEEQKYGDFKVIRESDKEPDNDYGEYWIVNEKEHTFKTPLKTSLLNTISNARILVEKKEPTDEDPRWYNLYSDGWLEQGGSFDSMTQDGSIIINLIKEYKDITYSIFTQQNNTKGYTNGNSNSLQVDVYNKTKTKNSFVLYECNYGQGGSWITKGYTTPPSVEQIANSENIGLYFKVANAVENLELINAGQILEDCVLKSELKEAQTVIDSYINGKSGYRVWSDGYCEQFGLYDNSQAGTIKLLKPYADFYNISVTPYVAGNAVYTSITNYNRQEFTFVCNSSATHGYYWQTSGYLTEGSY